MTRVRFLKIKSSKILYGYTIYHSIRQSMFFQNINVVKIKSGNSSSENEAKGHHPVLAVFHIVKRKKAKLQSFLDVVL